VKHYPHASRSYVILLFSTRAEIRVLGETTSVITSELGKEKVEELRMERWERRGERSVERSVHCHLVSLHSLLTFSDFSDVAIFFGVVSACNQ